MKSKIKLLVAAGMIIGLASCGPTIEPVDVRTVTFLNGDSVLHSVDVEDGKTVEEWDPTGTIEDEFLGWYAEPTLTHTFDFTVPITSDTKIFGSFVEFENDTREWVIAGSGTSGVLMSSNWGKVVNEEHKMSKENVKGENRFTYTLDLYVGDQFQFMVPVYADDGTISWGTQRGGGYLKNAGENFSTGGGLGGNTQKTNMTTNIEGNYTFTLVTYPANDLYFDDETDNPNQNYSNQDYISWVRNGDPLEEQAETNVDFYIKGATISNWKDMLNEFTYMVPNDDRSIYTLDIYLKEGEEFMFASRVTDTSTLEENAGNEYIRAYMVNEGREYVSGETNNMTAIASGLYSFEYIYDSQELNIKFDSEYEVPTYDYYLNGNFDNDPSWANKVGFEDYRFKETDDPEVLVLEGINLLESEQMGVQVTAKGDAKNRIGYYGYQYSVLCDGLVKAERGNNIVCEEAGTYNLSLNTYSKIITITKA